MDGFNLVGLSGYPASLSPVFGRRLSRNVTMVRRRGYPPLLGTPPAIYRNWQ